MVVLSGVPSRRVQRMDLISLLRNMLKVGCVIPFLRTFVWMMFGCYRSRSSHDITQQWEDNVGRFMLPEA